MARYRQKDETDLVWNRTRRHITQMLDIAIRDWRERVLNDLLSEAWDEYTAALGSGKLKEVEAKYSRLIDAILSDLIVPKELVRGDVEND